MLFVSQHFVVLSHPGRSELSNFSIHSDFFGKSDAVKESLRHAPPIKAFIRLESFFSDSGLGSLFRLWSRIFVQIMV